MCVLTAIHTSEVLVRFEDGMVYVAFELACGCVGLRPATLADLERDLPFLDSTPDAETADEPATLALAA